MFNLEELKLIKESLASHHNQSEENVNQIIKKINETLKSVEGYDKCLWSFYWDCGRQGDVEGIFKASKSEIDKALGKDVYFGEILGKHNEIYGVLEEVDLELLEEDPIKVYNAIESGYNPLDYLNEE